MNVISKLLIEHPHLPQLAGHTVPAFPNRFTDSARLSSEETNEKGMKN